MPLEVLRLGRTIRRWRHQIVAWHRSHVSNGPTEAINNLVKRVKRAVDAERLAENSSAPPTRTPSISEVGPNQMSTRPPRRGQNR